MKLYRYFPLLFPLLILSLGTSHAQITRTTIVSGNVVDSLTGNPIEYATVIAADSTMRTVGAVAADGRGRFTLTAKELGDFYLIVTAVGYGTDIQPLILDGSSGRMDVGEIRLVMGVEVEAVGITLVRPLITADPDKLTYSVESDPEAATSTLAEILRKVPQLSVDAEDNVLLNGSSSYKVLVNGKSSGMMARNFKEVIKSMPASSIKDIQVITNPSTKYEADGATGVINIITNRRRIDGYNGYLMLSGGLPELMNGAAYISAQIGKFTFSVNYWAHRQRHKDYLIDYRQEYLNSLAGSERYRNSLSNYDGRSFTHGLYTEASYEIDSLNLLTMSVWLNQQKVDWDYTNDLTSYDDGMQEMFKILDDAHQKTKWANIEADVNYERSFRKPDRLFTLSYKVGANLNNNRYFHNYDSVTVGRQTRNMYRNRANGSEHTVQADYYDPISQHHHIEGGFKYMFRTMISDNNRYIFENDIKIPDNSLPINDLDYDQHIFGAYAGYLFKMNKFSANAGFRIENTLSVIDSKTDGLSNNIRNNQFNIVPYLKFSYMLDQTQFLSAAYTQRLTRPGVSELNPFVDTNNPYFYTTGNPELDAAVSHQVNADYRLFRSTWNMYLGVFSTFAGKDIESYVTVYDDVLLQSYGNIGKLRSVGSYLSASYRFGAVASLYANGYVNYRKLESTKYDISNDGLDFSVSCGAMAALWKGGTVSAWAGFNRSNIGLQSSSSNMVWSQFSVTQKFLKDKLDVSVNASNPFTKYTVWSNTVEDESFRTFSRSKNPSRTVRLSIGYRFGKMDVNVRKARRGIASEDGAKSSDGGSASPQ